MVRVYNYTVCVRKDEWQPKYEGDVMLGAYVPPDSVVPDTPIFAFLKNLPPTRRIKVSKLRGVLSQGVLCHAPEGSQIGDDVSDILGVTRYDPKIIGEDEGGESSNVVEPPPNNPPVYDVETWHRYGSLFEEGEEVVVTEKVHGANSRFCYRGDKMYCGSRQQWKSFHPKSTWWACLQQNSWIQDYCCSHQDHTLYGEVYGYVQDLQYGCRKGQYKFVVFDVLAEFEDKTHRWLTVDECDELRKTNKDLNKNWVPLLYRGPYSNEEVVKYVDGPSTIPGANHIREGVVVKPVKERCDPEIGRVQLKIVSNEYLMRAK